jgi:hypothetical protein
VGDYHPHRCNPRKHFHLNIHGLKKCNHGLQKTPSWPQDPTTSPQTRMSSQMEHPTQPNTQTKQAYHPKMDKGLQRLPPKQACRLQIEQRLYCNATWYRRPQQKKPSHTKANQNQVLHQHGKIVNVDFSKFLRNFVQLRTL